MLSCIDTGNICCVCYPVHTEHQFSTALLVDLQFQTDDSYQCALLIRCADILKGGVLLCKRKEFHTLQHVHKVGVTTELEGHWDSFRDPRPPRRRK